MLRLSNYAIFVELGRSETLLVHGYSGAWDIVTNETANIIRSFRCGPVFKPLIGKSFRGDEDWANNSRTPGCLAIETQQHLQQRGYLTELTAAEEQAHVSKLAAGLHRVATYDPPSYVFALTYACNLRCAYCFQDELRSKPEHAPRLALMSKTMVDRIFAAMPEVEAKHGFMAPYTRGQPTRAITLFGGEPLLSEHHELISYIIKRAQGEGSFSCLAVTNGTELQHFADLIGPGKISFLQITLDGAPNEHNKRRIGYDKAPTFQRIANNIDLALELGTYIKLRINADKENIESLPELASICQRRGWFDAVNFSAYATPVHESNGGKHESCGFGSWNLGVELERLARQHSAVGRISGPDTFWERRVREVLRGSEDPLLNMKPTFCGAHSQTWVFDAHGDIYACWERAGYIEDRIGRLSSDGKLSMDEAIERRWRGRTVASNPVCGRCPYAFYCGGGCALLAERANGSIHSNYCDNFSQRFKSLAAKELELLKTNILARAAVEAASA
jgi:uncharacterized protein